jgi:ATPase family associated with various cellular activities (AAA)
VNTVVRPGDQTANTALVIGPPGTGKTTVAQVIAAEMAQDYTEILGAEGVAAGLADRVDLHDVRVLQAGDCLGLGPEALTLGAQFHGCCPALWQTDKICRFANPTQYGIASGGPIGA